MKFQWFINGMEISVRIDFQQYCDLTCCAVLPWMMQQSKFFEMIAYRKYIYASIFFPFMLTHLNMHNQPRLRNS